MNVEDRSPPARDTSKRVETRNSFFLWTPRETARQGMLRGLNICYPGWEQDWEEAQQLCGEPAVKEEFDNLVDGMKEKQYWFKEYRTIDRLNQLDRLNLSYPGFEEDSQAVEEWNLKYGNLEDEDTSVMFQEMIEGLKNKQRLFDGDRNHPNIKELDSLELSYPTWEDDYHVAIQAHCNSPRVEFRDAIHSLREKQDVHDGKRTHWRLVELDKLKLTYPGWEDDVKDVEEWHFKTSDSPAADSIFAEVLEGMRDQEQIYLGWDFGLISASSEDSDPTAGSWDDSTISTLSNVSAKHYKDLEERKNKVYESISDSMAQQHEERRKVLMEQRLSSKPHKQSRGKPPLPTKKNNDNSSPKKQDMEEEKKVDQEESSPKESNIEKFGKCVLCQTRPTTHVFVPCGHLCACAACSHKAVETSGVCPICRIPSEKPYRVFSS